MQQWARRSGLLQLAKALLHTVEWLFELMRRWLPTLARLLELVPSVACSVAGPSRVGDGARGIAGVACRSVRESLDDGRPMMGWIGGRFGGAWIDGRARQRAGWRGWNDGRSRRMSAGCRWDRRVRACLREKGRVARARWASVRALVGKRPRSCRAGPSSLETPPGLAPRGNVSAACFSQKPRAGAQTLRRAELKKSLRPPRAAAFG